MTTSPSDYRSAIAEFIREEAQPVDKFTHQPRLYHLARTIGEGMGFDDDILYAAAWLHDLGVFQGHRPRDLDALSKWDNVTYAVQQAPGLLQKFGFPPDKIPAVAEAIRTHLPSGSPTQLEGQLLRDADILEQLGAVGIARAISKVGRDTRFPTHGHALRLLRRIAGELPAQLRFDRARALAKPRLALLNSFLEAAEAEGGGVGL